MRVPHESLVAIADSRKLPFLRNEGDADKPPLRTEQVALDEIERILAAAD